MLTYYLSLWPYHQLINSHLLLPLLMFLNLLTTDQVMYSQPKLRTCFEFSLSILSPPKMLPVISLGWKSDLELVTSLFIKLTKIVTTLLKKHVLYTWKNSLFSTYIEYLIYHISARAKVFIYLWKTNFNKKPNINEILQQYMYTCIPKLLFHERTICIG